jgi:predicted GNAT superfamily acetyltransferase
VQDADDIVAVARATWGLGEALPREFVVALGESGNPTWAAFHGDEMVAYALGWLGVDAAERLHLHSHMLAARPDRRHRGIGAALKLAQRADCLDRGVMTARWTFDPLIARNAHLNITKLGAVCDGFHRNLYGAMTDVLNAGDRSDRLVVRWDLEREPGPRVISAGAETSSVEIPADYPALRAQDPDAAASVRDEAARLLTEAFDRGLEVLAFDADREGGHPRYLLAPSEVAP